MNISDIVSALVPIFTARKLKKLIAQMQAARGRTPDDLHVMRWVAMQMPDAPPQDPRWTEALALAREALANGSLVLLGNRGTGKSQLAVSLLAEACQRKDSDSPRPPQMLLLSDMLLRLRATFSPEADTTERQEMEKISQASLLIVDELQDGSGTTWAEQKLTDCIAARYQKQLPTVFCANVSEDKLADALGASISDRFTEGSSGVLDMNWASVRADVPNLPKLSALLAALGPLAKKEEVDEEERRTNAEFEKRIGKK